MYRFTLTLLYYIYRFSLSIVRVQCGARSEECLHCCRYKAAGVCMEVCVIWLYIQARVYTVKGYPVHDNRTVSSMWTLDTSIIGHTFNDKVLTGACPLLNDIFPRAHWPELRNGQIWATYIVLANTPISDIFGGGMVNMVKGAGRGLQTPPAPQDKDPVSIYNPLWHN